MPELLEGKEVTKQDTGLSTNKAEPGPGDPSAIVQALGSPELLE